MSCTFDLKNLLIFTGGVDGALIGWNFDTKFARYYLHQWDETCMSENFIADSKSVDSLIIMKKERLLISMSADQWLRFWDIDDLQSQRPPVFKFHAGHMNTFADDQLTGVAITKANDRFVTTDTVGRIKMFNISRIQAPEGQDEGLIKSQNHTNEQKMALVSNPWFINAHRKLISSVEIVEQNMDPIEDDDSDDANIELPEGLAPEEKTPWPDIFVLTAG